MFVKNAKNVSFFNVFKFKNILLFNKSKKYKK